MFTAFRAAKHLKVLVHLLERQVARCDLFSDLFIVPLLELVVLPKIALGSSVFIPGFGEDWQLRNRNGLGNLEVCEVKRMSLD